MAFSLSFIGLNLLCLRAKHNRVLEIIITLIMSHFFKITLKFTDGKQLQVDVEPHTTIQELKAIVEAETETPDDKIKLVYRGKMTQVNDTIQGLGIDKPATIIVVLSKVQKKKQTLQPIETIPTNFQTGLGNFNPVGVGNFGIMNHPEYMSALSGVMNEDKLEQMMDDPFYQQMIDEMLKDPETVVRMMEENPVTKRMMDSNPMMKAMMSNPETAKLLFNSQTIKTAMEMKKKGNLPNLNDLQSQMSANPGGAGFPFMAQQQSMPMQGMGYNPFMMMNNPFFNMGQMPNSANSVFPTVPKQEQKKEQMPDRQKYASQLKELKEMGFTDEQKLLEALKKANGNIWQTVSYLES